MKLVKLIVIAVISLILNSCVKEKIDGHGPLTTENRNIVNFSGIDLRVSANLYFTKDISYKVQLTAQQNILDVMEAYVSNNRLIIKFRNDVRVSSHEPIEILVSAPSANSFRLSGTGNIFASGDLTPASMEMDVSGSGNIQVEKFATGFVDAAISGLGSISVMSGTATEEKLNISGSGNIDLVNVAGSRATTNTSGSGDMKVNVSQTLDVTISGSGSVYYKGTPAITTKITGSGNIIHL